MSGIKQRHLGRWMIVTALSATTMGAGTALGGPTWWESTGWNQPVTATAGGWFTSTDGGTTILGKRDAAYPPTAFLQAKYCNRFGPSTQIAGMSVTRTRYHANTNDLNGWISVYTPQGKDYGVDGGQLSTKTTRRHLRNMVLEGVNMELLAQTPVTGTYTFPGGQCVWSRIAVSGNNDAIIDTPGYRPSVTNRLTRVLVEDLQGPAVTHVTAPAGWVTGDSVTVDWDSSDNAYKRGTTGARVVGAATTDIGAAANAHHSAAVGVGALADGEHSACAYRTAPGWSEASGCVAFRLDRTNPGIPGVTFTPDTPEWTGAAVSVATTAADDGQGSGWSHNQIRVDGGDWVDIFSGARIDADGEHTVQVRAVDRAGRVGAPTAPHTVRIDRTAPTVTNTTINGATGTLAWTMSDANGFGGCHVRVAVSGPGTNGAMVEVVDRSAAELTPGAATVVLPIGTMANGEYTVRLTVCDLVGNPTTVNLPMWWTGNPDGELVGAWARFVPMDLSSPGVLDRRDINGIIVPSIRRVFGKDFVLRGRLQRPDGTALATTALELRDGLGRRSTGLRTDTLGRFTVTARATVGGVWTLNTIGSKVRQPVARLAVKPLVYAGATMTNHRRVLVVNGRMAPGVGVSGKAVHLQWFDRLTGVWRPVLNGRISSTGRYRLVYRFSRPGRYTVKVRVVVPKDAGWPYLTGISRTLTVRVG